MGLRTIALAMCLGFGTLVCASAQQMTAKDVQDKLAADGYTNVHDINFGPEATTARATKDGKEWLLVIDSHGKVLQQQ